MPKRRMTIYTPFKQLEVGRVFPVPPASFFVTEEIVDAYLEATGDDTPAFRKGAEPRPAPPTLAAVYMLDALGHFRNPPGGIHTKQSFTFHRPAYVGDRLESEVRILEKYSKKNRDYVAMEIVTRNQRGELVTSGIITRIWGKEP